MPTSRPNPNPTPPGAPITLVAHDLGGVGGMESVLGQLAGGLLAAGHPVTVISRTCQLPRHHLLTWVRVPGPSRPFALAYPWFFVLGSLIAWRRRSGVVLSTGAIIANWVDFSAVHYCHYATQDLSRASRRTILYRLNAWAGRYLRVIGERICYTPARVGCLIGVSRGVSAELAEHFPQLRRETVPNGVSLERFAPDPGQRATVRERHSIGEDELVALFVGSEWKRKGLSLAIDALAAAEPWKLLVVGDGNLAAYREHARRAGVLDRVIFAGPADDPAPYYCAADAFVLPTAYETFSLVTYEAAASGLPLLVTPVHGVTDLLVDGHNGWFIERDTRAIADKLMRLADDDRLRAAMGAAGRDAAAAFTWARMVSGYRSLLCPTDGGGERVPPLVPRPSCLAAS